MKIKLKLYIFMLFVLISSSLCSCCSCLFDDYDTSQLERELKALEQPQSEAEEAWKAYCLFRLNRALMEGDFEVLREFEEALKQRAEQLSEEQGASL